MPTLKAEVRVTGDYYEKRIHARIIEAAEVRLSYALGRVPVDDIAETLGRDLFRSLYGEIELEYRTLFQRVMHELPGQPAMSVNVFFKPVDEKFMAYKMACVQAVKDALGP